MFTGRNKHKKMKIYIFILYGYVWVIKKGRTTEHKAGHIQQNIPISLYLFNILVGIIPWKDNFAYSRLSPTTVCG